MKIRIALGPAFGSKTLRLPAFRVGTKTIQRVFLQDSIVFPSSYPSLVRASASANDEVPVSHVIFTACSHVTIGKSGSTLS